MTTLFISDLHLSSERPAIVEAFIDFLQGPARSAEALYILGDLFEVWLGDDAVVEEYRPVLAAMKALADSGVKLYVMYGNRDFLMGAEFERMTGCRLIADPLVIDLYGTPTLLMHGDLLCTDDSDYQRLRLMLRDEGWQQAFLAKPLAERLQEARALREKSKQAMQEKSLEIMDVNPSTVDDYLRRYQVQHLIHGHTHRPAHHSFELDGAAAQRIVLPEWYEQGGVLQCDEQGCTTLPV